MVHAQKICKMPDFKRIHEKAFGNMENLDDFITKKQIAGESVKKVNIMFIICFVIVYARDEYLSTYSILSSGAID